MKIDKSEHTKLPWKVQDLLKDFRIEDVWLLPVELDETHSLNDVLTQLGKAKNSIPKKGITVQLFKLRLFLGKLFNWDNRSEHLAKLTNGKIRNRYAKTQQLTSEDLPKGSYGNFTLVYSLENEYLFEIENTIVQAAIHYSRIYLASNKWKVHMSIYVKPKGLFGQLYMLAIKPFRLLIVYPALMKALKLQWDNFLQLERIK
jgi:hypothetical protein